MIVLGFDPGLYGAFATYDGKQLYALAIPTVEAKGRGREINRAFLVDAFELYGLGEADHAFVEKVGARPKDGKSSVFKFGRATGQGEMLISVHRIGYTEVPPAVWKRALGLIGQPKTASVARALELFPESPQFFTPKRGVLNKKQIEGVAEAALLSWYGYHKLNGGL